MAIIDIYPKDAWEVPTNLPSIPSKVDYGLILPYDFPVIETDSTLQGLYHKELTNLLNKEQQCNQLT